MPPAITAKEEWPCYLSSYPSYSLPLLRREEELEEPGGEKGVGQRN